jgi:hypothetical protein
VPQDGASRGIAHAQHHRGRLSRQLGHEPRSTGGDLFATGWSILWWSTLDDVGNEVVLPGKTDLFFDESREELTTAPNERRPTFVLVTARSLTDHD